MAYGLPALGEYQDGTVPSESMFQKFVDSTAHLASLTKGNDTLDTLSASKELQDPDYDSGWFAISTSTTYDKAHSLGVRPRQVFVWFSSSASPADGDYIEIVRNPSYGNIQLNTTNVRVVTGSQFSLAGATAGFFRILAWI